jgi:hypothetical protein
VLSDPSPERNIRTRPRHEIDRSALKHRVKSRGRVAGIFPVRDQGGDTTLTLNFMFLHYAGVDPPINFE